MIISFRAITPKVQTLRTNLLTIGKKTLWKTFPYKWKTLPYKRRTSPRTWKAFPYRFFLMRKKCLSHHWHFRVGAAVIFRHFDSTQTPLGQHSYNCGTVLLQLWDDTLATVGQYFHTKPKKQKKLRQRRSGRKNHKAKKKEGMHNHPVTTADPHRNRCGD